MSAACPSRDPEHRSAQADMWAESARFLLVVCRRGEEPADEVAPTTPHVLQSKGSSDMSLKSAIAADRRGNLALQQSLNAGAVLQTGTNAASVKWLERMLTLNGFKPGTVDNTFSANTAASLRAFQKAWGLPQTGTLDKATFSKLKHTQTRIRNSQKVNKGKNDTFGERCVGRAPSRSKTARPRPEAVRRPRGWVP